MAHRTITRLDLTDSICRLMRNRAATGPKHRPVSRIAAFGANTKTDT